MITLSDIASLDVKTFPTEVLKALNFATHRELSMRRNRERIQVKEQAQAFPGTPYYTREPSSYLQKYYAMLLEQDWSNLFSGDQAKKYYVYAHVKPSNKQLRIDHDALPLHFDGLPFYIGKGTGDRAYDLKRNQGHGALLKELQDSGVEKSRVVKIICECLSEPKALELESKLIYLFGTKYETDRKGILVNLDVPARPEFMPYKKWIKSQT